MLPSGTFIVKMFIMKPICIVDVLIDSLVTTNVLTTYSCYNAKINKHVL